ncbi:hypothetical protein [Leucobacter soli]
MAEACYYLISRASSYVTGAVLPVDGDSWRRSPADGSAPGAR